MYYQYAKKIIAIKLFDSIMLRFGIAKVAKTNWNISKDH